MSRSDSIGADVPTLGIEVDFGPQGIRAVYFRLSNLKVSETIESVEPDVFIDVDSKGNLVGIELINPAVVHLRELFHDIAEQFESSPLKNLRETRIRQLQKMVTV